MKPHQIKRPSPLLYIPLIGLANLYTRLAKRHRIYGYDGVKKLTAGPLLVIGNHTSFPDFLYMARVFYPHRINFVVAAKYFRFKELSFILRLGQTIPKNLFSPDIRTVARATSVIKQRGMVGIYPEGQISLGGITLPLPEGIGKLVKHLGAPVVAVKTCGAGFVNPPWTNGHRKGLVESYVKLVLTKEEISSLDQNDIDIRLKDALFVNPYEWQVENGNQYKGKDLTLGLTHILYICPNCLGEFTLETASDKIVCSHCGLTASMTGSGHFHWEGEKVFFDHIGTWYQWQYLQEKAMVLATEKYRYTLPVQLAMYRQPQLGIESVGDGTMTITREEYVYQGTQRGEPVSLHFATKNIRYVPYDGGRNFQIYDNNQLHEFRPSPGILSVKASLVGETMYHLSQGIKK